MSASALVVAKVLEHPEIEVRVAQRLRQHGARPWSDEQITADPVTTRVGNSAFDDPACVQPLSAS